MLIHPKLQIEDYLARLAAKDFRQSLEPMRQACRWLGNPERSATVVHIAGTNGKGSTAAFLNAILQSAGYSVGLITSPHLIDVTERIQIDRQPIRWEALWEVVEKIRRLLPNEDFLSYFEMTVLAGFEYFSEWGVDIAVVETGMGGRLDATNVVAPQIAILTTISHDHEQYLGDTLMQIAEEKCGILKRDCQVVSAPQAEEVRFVIEERCRQLGVELFWADPEKITAPLGLKGEHQKINAACALTAARLLLADDLIDTLAAEALQKTVWPGRLQYLRDNFLIDGAHNPGGIEALARYLKEYHAGQSIYFLLGCLADKNWPKMFAPLAELAARFICVTPPHPRGLPASRLAQHLEQYEVPVVACEAGFIPAEHEGFGGMGPSTERQRGWGSVPPNPNDLLVATGSLYMIGEILKCFPKTG